MQGYILVAKEVIYSCPHSSESIQDLEEMHSNQMFSNKIKTLLFFFKVNPQAMGGLLIIQSLVLNVKLGISCLPDKDSVCYWNSKYN